MKKNAILFSKVDREDLWVTNGIVFEVQNTNTYVDAFNEIKDKLDNPEIFYPILERIKLETEDDTFKLNQIYWNYGLHFVFTNEFDEEYDYKMSADFVFIP